MKSVDHRLNAPLYEFIKTDMNDAIALELVDNGSLLEYISGHRALPEFFYQLIAALDYLYHENVLLEDTMNIDFGFDTDSPLAEKAARAPRPIACSGAECPPSHRNRGKAGMKIYGNMLKCDQVNPTS
jgi:hypothetical protein